MGFWKCHKPLVAKNEKLKGIHANETCFIFANGASLKYYDISNIPNTPAIVCAYQLIDRRMAGVNVKYYVAGVDSYSMYSVLYNTYPAVRRFQISRIKKIFAGVLEQCDNITCFANITNFYSSLCRRKNMYFFHYFEDKEGFSDDLGGSFSNCRAAIDTMLGVAKYVGFSEAVLIGCDYLGTPPTMGHFYADSAPFAETHSHLAEYRSRVKRAASGISVRVILPEGSVSPDFEYDSYENYFGLERQYRENIELIDGKYIEMLRRAARANQAQM